MGIDTMGSYGMKSARVHTKGFTLIASLLLLALLSAMAIGLLMMVNTEGKVGGTDLQNDIAYHSAEGGIEKMASDLAATFQNLQAPTAAQICAVSSTPPTVAGVTWTTYSVTPVSGCTAALKTNWGQISSGPDQGLWAQIIPVNMQATAALVGGQEVSMTRSAQVALIPVFQFGVFCEGDCAFFSNPTLDFNGRIHTNGDLYLGVADGYTITFHDKLEAYGNVVRENLPNTLPASSSNDSGTVYIPFADGDCPIPPAAPAASAGNCVVMQQTDGSVTGMGGNPPASTYNGTTGWYTFSKTKTDYEIINGNYGNTAVNQTGTGAKKLSMPFVGGNVKPYEIIRRPPAGEDPTSAVGTSREYNMAQIRVLLSDDPTEFTNGTGYSDLDNVRLANLSAAQAQAQYGNTTATATNQWGITIPAGYYNAATFGNPTAGNTYNLYFAAASNAVPIPSSCVAGPPPVCNTPDWPYAPGVWATNVLNTLPAFQGLQPAGVAAGPNAPTYLNNGATPTINLCPPAGVNATSVPAPTTNCPWTGAYPYYAPPNPIPNGTAPVPAYNSANSNAWSLVDGYLRVEYKDKGGNWHPVTREWLGLGFARGATAPTANGAGAPVGGTANPITPNAILLLQEPADRSGANALAAAPTAVAGVWAVSQATAPSCTKWSGAVGTSTCQKWTAGTVPLLASDLGSGGQWAFGVTPAAPVATPLLSATPQSVTQYNWYPINFYDAREGEARDVKQNNNSCTTNGVMNAVEIDVGNLQQWLKGLIGKDPVLGTSSGTSVDYAQQNGYVLYFSDRRGMLLNPNTTGPHPGNSKSGDSGLEDVVNASSQAGTPDGALETPGGVNSPEDDNLNGVLDNFGTTNMGLGQYNGAANQNLNQKITAVNPDNPYNPRINSCSTDGRKSWVSGARHVLKLVDGSLGNLPISPKPVVVTNPDGTTTNYYGGFTVASENPVYIQGDYNSSAVDTFFSSPKSTAPTNDKAGHVPAAVIADAVTILSDGWDDRNSMVFQPTEPVGNRTAQTTYYRVAIAGGKNKAFPFPGWASANPDYSFGTDGGVGNFLRFLEDWSGNGVNLNYGGSMVSLYYATYDTGIFKCCTYSVYKPPNRNYIFDADFTVPEGLPPGTPMFRDVESLGYRQLFTTRNSTTDQ